MTVGVVTNHSRGHLHHRSHLRLRRSPPLHAWPSIHGLLRGRRLLGRRLLGHRLLGRRLRCRRLHYHLHRRRILRRAYLIQYRYQSVMSTSGHVLTYLCSSRFPSLCCPNRHPNRCGGPNNCKDTGQPTMPWRAGAEGGGMVVVLTGGFCANSRHCCRFGRCCLLHHPS